MRHHYERVLEAVGRLNLLPQECTDDTDEGNSNENAQQQVPFHATNWICRINQQPEAVPLFTARLDNGYF